MQLMKKQMLNYNLFSHNTVESISLKLDILYDFFSKIERELKK